ncbi:M14 family metallopeptidase [Nakamurella deserti]|uniref:M14 family metallopeptidase n=1 Tax=Nakamurella deserti TaxID=2164074 RepID=UPI000DBE64CA|nr:M14 family metallopeptidase [Nakamurella deserti]
MKRVSALLIAAVLTAGMVIGTPVAAQAPPPADTGGPSAYVGDLTAPQQALLWELGVDRREVRATAGARAGSTRVEVVLTDLQVETLRRAGLALEERPSSDTTGDRRSVQESVFRPYSGPGGLLEEYRSLAAAHPTLVKLVSIGTTVQGTDIIALKVTRDAGTTRDGRRPAVLYAAAQHAREWITPEMNRRLLRYYVDNYRTDRRIRSLLDSTELWFIPVANPDGYDFTFTEGNRLWRKNLRDNDGDGVITGSDGVDLNRNFPTKWGYDNEGSSSTPGSDTYRGPSAASEPETRAYDGLLSRVDFAFLINYHSAAELLLYGVGSQVATPTPDDLLYEAMVGDNQNPAVPGYDPDLSAELYTTNGETTEHAQAAYGTLAFTPEMSTCQTVSAIDPDDAFEPDACESGFNFPDSEPLIQAEFEKNLPFAVAVAESAGNPAYPVSVVGRTAPDFAVDTFEVSYGRPQTVAVVARRDLRDLHVRYRINGGKERRLSVAEWGGGERYGDTGDVYFAEYRAAITRAEPGDSVEVWFAGRRAGRHSDAAAPESRGHGHRGWVQSEHFTYTVVDVPDTEVLVIADEDYEGVNPTYPATVTAPKYAQEYVDALAAAGHRATVWDVTAQGVPHDLGVLAHFPAVVWYLGDNRLTQDPEDELTDIGGESYPDAAVAERQQYLTLAVRDHLNAGGKLAFSGETAAYYGPLAGDFGGLLYGLDGAPDQDCAIPADFSTDCLVLSDDFTQYYLGAFARTTSTGPTGAVGTAEPFTGGGVAFGGPATVANPLDEAGAFLPTSAVLPESEFPQFRSWVSGRYEGGEVAAPFEPLVGNWYAATPHADSSWTRLTRTVDLGAVTAAETPTLAFGLSFDTEPSYDNVIVEVHTVGSDDWTTLPEAGGRTTTDVPAECEVGFLLADHPFLGHYLTPGEEACTPTGTTGSWHAMTGNSGGWQQVAFDLSAYAGSQIEVSVAYVTDPGFGGLGVAVDDTRLLVGGAVAGAEGFEDGLGAWSVTGPPEGSPANGVAFGRSQSLFGAAVTTPDTVLFGFGVEQVADPAARAALLGATVEHLLGS